MWSPCCVLQVSNGWTFLQDDVAGKTQVSSPKRIVSTKSRACVVVPRRGAKLLRIALENAKMYDFTRRVCSNLVSEDLSLLAVPILDADKARELFFNYA